MEQYSKEDIIDDLPGNNNIRASTDLIYFFKDLARLIPGAKYMHGNMQVSDHNEFADFMNDLKNNHSDLIWKDVKFFSRDLRDGFLSRIEGEIKASISDKSISPANIDLDLKIFKDFLDGKTSSVTTKINWVGLYDKVYSVSKQYSSIKAGNKIIDDTCISTMKRWMELYQTTFQSQSYVDDAYRTCKKLSEKFLKAYVGDGVEISSEIEKNFTSMCRTLKEMSLLTHWAWQMMGVFKSHIEKAIRTKNINDIKSGKKPLPNLGDIFGSNKNHESLESFEEGNNKSASLRYIEDIYRLKNTLYTSEAVWKNAYTNLELLGKRKFVDMNDPIKAVNSLKNRIVNKEYVIDSLKDSIIGNPDKSFSEILYFLENDGIKLFDRLKTTVHTKSAPNNLLMDFPNTINFFSKNVDGKFTTFVDVSSLIKYRYEGDLLVGIDFSNKEIVINYIRNALVSSVSTLVLMNDPKQFIAYLPEQLVAFMLEIYRTLMYGVMEKVIKVNDNEISNNIDFLIYVFFLENHLNLDKNQSIPITKRILSKEKKINENTFNNIVSAYMFTNPGEPASMNDPHQTALDNFIFFVNKIFEPVLKTKIKTNEFVHTFHTFNGGPQYLHLIDAFHFFFSFILSLVYTSSNMQGTANYKIIKSLTSAKKTNLKNALDIMTGHILKSSLFYKIR